MSIIVKVQTVPWGPRPLQEYNYLAESYDSSPSTELVDSEPLAEGYTTSSSAGAAGKRSRVKHADQKSGGDGRGQRRTVLHLVRRGPVDQRRALLRCLDGRNFSTARTAVSHSVQRVGLIGTTAAANCHCISDRDRMLGPGVRTQFRAVFRRSILKISFTNRIILIGYCSNVTGTTYRIFSTLG